LSGDWLRFGSLTLSHIDEQIQIRRNHQRQAFTAH
jgi:hypothetical protein